MPKTKILVVEDDQHLSKLIQYNFEKSGFQCIVAASAEDGLTHLEPHPVDLILLDIMLPEMDGFEFCRKLKQDRKQSHIPIIMLTAKSEEIDRIVGFELGVDDFVPKPFSIRELILRAKAILKRGKKSTEAEKEETLGIDRLTIDIPRHRVTVSGKEITLTHIEFKLLRTLLQRKGKVQSRDTLLDDVWDIEADVTTRTVDTHIRHLRQKLGTMGKWIETVRGLGYRFAEEDRLRKNH